ncbi:retrotransposon protein, putative, ty1-copia subclass [Tanacetum coccineum]|uniref:Retrotransposon protein, putative, ty1-copia subclass n=1 Tax=Tanacetum coccineum TaxID=301880 RepID=A0ABQ5D9S5_9ASTR
MVNLTTLPLSFWDYALEFVTRILNMVPNKKVDKTPYELWYGKVPNLSYLKDTQRKQWVTTSTSYLKTKLLLQGEKPQTQIDVAPISMSKRTHRALHRLSLNVEAKEHSLGDLNKPTNYKVALSDLESNKWLDAINLEMQSMKDNLVWHLVDLNPNDKTVGSKWLFKKKTDMDDVIHTYKAHLVAKGYTQTYRIDYE